MALRAGSITIPPLSSSSSSSSSSSPSLCHRPNSYFPGLHPLPCTNLNFVRARPLLPILRAQTLSSPSPSPSSTSSSRTQKRPSSAEEARTLVDVCNEGVLCTSSIPDGWPFGSSVRFAIEAEHGSPVFNLHPSHLHSKYLLSDCRCSLHIQMEQHGHRKTQCTFKGRVSRVEDAILNEKLRDVWEKRFGEESKDGDCFHLMKIESILHSLDYGEPSALVSTLEYEQASADPLRDCAAKIIEDMNRNHWEDIRQFCNVYAQLDLMVEEARLTWVDHLGFDMSILTNSQELVEIRIPFSREVVDERDARSSLTMMAQRAWEHQRGYNLVQRFE